ncbi:hypothetical protein H310_11052 [Aphanomyces invadans]|uniref:Uncharacterized protein n=1 Tax=Aphanomyces invadans TaxID=157072 RepID=A0A024TNN6_9STRA|nr:hypothetical protein H310_11052 [Aphanomyces invadans]ETV95624.1 hypothetical protein H310_11052 [Aphanomyces invadans]|eukprot:XP_008875817.1 hypothetical protein H310_11052 [Aphanomyces invadans]
MLDALRAVWAEIGLDVADQEAELDRQLHEFYQYKLMDANNTKGQYLDDIASMQEDMATFVRQLGEPFEAPTKGPPPGTLKEQEAHVRRDYDVLKKAVDDRTTVLSAVLKELSSIQALMGEAPEAPPQPLDLTTTVLDKCKEALRMKKMEQAQRRQAILHVATEYRSLVDQLKLVDLTDFDRSIITNVEALGQSLNLIELMSARIADLTRLRAEREAAKTSAMAQIRVLWDRLKVSPNERDEFLDACQGISADNLRQAEDELARLQQLKRARLGDLLLDVRGHIRELWSVLEVNDLAAATMFPAMQVATTDATDELLVIHEDELKRLDAQATARKALLKYIEKREEIIDDRSQYEASLKGPTRLIGRQTRDTGRLLREEKLQAKIKHDLPKLTKLLLDKLPAWEGEFASPFLVRGERYLDTIARVDAEYSKQKELDRLEKDRLKREKKAVATDDKLGVSTPKPKWLASKGGPPALTKRMSCPNQLSAAEPPPSPLVVHNAVALARDSSKTKLVGPET